MSEKTDHDPNHVTRQPPGESLDERSNRLQQALDAAKGGSSGIIAEELARADRDTRGARTTTPDRDTPGNLALEALSLANGYGGESPEEVVNRAAAYLDFLKEKQNG